MLVEQTNPCKEPTVNEIDQSAVGAACRSIDNQGNRPGGDIIPNGD